MGLRVSSVNRLNLLNLLVFVPSQAFAKLCEVRTKMCSAETNTLTLKQVLLRDVVYFVSASVVVVVKLV